MSTFNHLSLQQSIYQTLSNDTTLMALVTGVFDRVPQDSAYPYIAIGESAGSDWSTKTIGGMQQILGLRIWSREGGRAQAATIMERIHTLLHMGPLHVTGQTLVLIRFMASTIILQNDGFTYQGHMTFRALLQAD